MLKTRTDVVDIVFVDFFHGFRSRQSCFSDNPQGALPSQSRFNSMAVGIHGKIPEQGGARGGGVYKNGDFVLGMCGES